MITILINVRIVVQVSNTCQLPLQSLHVLPPHLNDNGGDVHHILQGSLLQSHVSSDLDACPSYASTEGRDKRLVLFKEKALHLCRLH